MQLDFQVDTKSFTTLNAAPAMVNKAISRAVTRVLDSMRTELTQRTATRYYITSTEIRKSITARSYTAGDIRHGILTAKGLRIPLAKFKISPKSPSFRMKGKPYQAAVKREGGLKTLAPNAFYVPSKKQAFRRIAPGGRGFRNLRVLMGPAVPQMLKNEQTLKEVTDKAEEVFKQRFNHEIERLLFA